MAIEMWTTHSLEKLFPESRKPARAGAEIRLKAARNETEDAQVALHVPKDEAIGRALFTLPDLEGPDGARIGREHLFAAWQWYTYVLYNPCNSRNPGQNNDPTSYLRKAPAFFPDAFLEQPVIKIRDEWTQPLWVSVRVPRDAAPGEYRGVLTIALTARSGGAEQTLEVPITLTVWPFTLPDENHLRHSEWFAEDALCEYYRIEPWSEAYWTWVERVAENMGRHRQDMVPTGFPRLVQVTRATDGTLEFDFSRLDRWIETFRRHGVPWIEGGQVAGRAGDWESEFVWSRFPILNPDGSAFDTSREAIPDAEFEPYIERFLKAIHSHLAARGWAANYVQHVADEPVPQNEESWRRRAGAVRAWLPGVPIIEAVMSEGVTGFIDIRVPRINAIRPDTPRHTGEQLWSYVCLGPQGQWPNRFLDYPSIRNRIIFWLSWTMGLKGFLHWGYNYWRMFRGTSIADQNAIVPVSPWTDATAGGIYLADRLPLPAGDPHIVYPGKETICSSVRWEVVRKGFEDFEYLYMLEQAAAVAKGELAARANALLERVRSEIAPDPARHTRDDRLLLAVREEIGELLAAFTDG